MEQQSWLAKYEEFWEGVGRSLLNFAKAIAVVWRVAAPIMLIGGVGCIVYQWTLGPKTAVGIAALVLLLAGAFGLGLKSLNIPNIAKLSQ